MCHFFHTFFPKNGSSGENSPSKTTMGNDELNFPATDLEIYIINTQLSKNYRETKRRHIAIL